MKMVTKRYILLVLVGMMALVALAQQGNATLAGSYTWEYKQAIKLSTDIESLETVGGSAIVTIAPSTKTEGGLTITGMFPNALEATVVSNEGVDYLVIAEGQKGGTEEVGDYVVNGVYYFEGDDKNDPGWYFDDIYGVIHDDGSVSFDRHWFYRVLSGGEYDGKDLVPYWCAGSTLTRAAQQEVVTPPQSVVEQAREYVMSYTDENGAALSKVVLVGQDGNDVYMQGMSKYLPDAWVKGTKNGSQVTFAVRQYMGKTGSYGASFFFCNGTTVFTYDAQADTYSVKDIVYGMLAEVYTDGYYNNPVLSRVEDKAATPANPEISAVTTDVYGWYTSFSVPAVDIENHELLPSKLSYQFYVDVEHDISSLTFTPDTHTKLTKDMTAIPYGYTDGFDFYTSKIYLNTLYSEDWNKVGIQSIYTGGGEEHRSEISWFTLKDYGGGGDPDPGMVPEDPVDAPTVLLPYSNNFSTAQQIDDVVVVDANEDGKTWAVGSGRAVYEYSSTMAANDWLVYPQVLLEKDKKYSISVRAYAMSSYYYEKIEVRAAKMATSYELNRVYLLKNGLVVIPTTKVDNITSKSFENTSFTVDEGGYYNIAVHAVSPASMWTLTVDGFQIEEVTSTGISTVKNAAALKDGQLFNLNGQRVEKARKGLYVVNGRKVVAK
jgi:hypothetical protein